MRRHDLDVFDLPLAIRALIFDAYVGKVNMAVDHGKVATRCPFGDVIGCSIAIALGAAALAIEVAEEALIVAFQLVIERDALHVEPPRCRRSAAWT